MPQLQSRVFWSYVKLASGKGSSLSPKSSLTEQIECDLDPGLSGMFFFVQQTSRRGRVAARMIFTEAQYLTNKRPDSVLSHLPFLQIYVVRRKVVPKCYIMKLF